MGHSDMKVSLTYLRGLEVKQLDVEDLPVFLILLRINNPRWFKKFYDLVENKQVYPIGVKQYNLVVMGLCTSW